MNHNYCNWELTQLLPDNNYYVYRHIRLDKNIPFYIGKGVIYHNAKSERERYKRAFTTTKRNKIWKNISQKSLYKVEIIYECFMENEIFKKETEFINLYGRLDLKTGTLCNLTDGGEGSSGLRHNSNTKEKIKHNSPFFQKRGKLHHSSKPLKVYSVSGEFVGEYESIRLCIDALGVDMGAISRVFNGKQKQHKGYVFKRA